MERSEENFKFQADEISRPRDFQRDRDVAPSLPSTRLTVVSYSREFGGDVCTLRLVDVSPEGAVR